MSTPAASNPPSIAFYSFNGEDALAEIRMLGPARAAGLRLIQGVAGRSVNVEAVREGDLVILQREFAVDYEAYEQVVALARATGKPLILDLDDLLLALPAEHPDRLAGNYAPALLPVWQSLLEADLLTVSSASLRQALLPYNPSIEVIPNYLDDSLWQLIPPHQASSDTLTIGYMGGHSHTPDLALVEPALLQLTEKYPQRIHFQFWGIQPPASLAAFSSVDWFPPRSAKYADFVDFFQQQQADILIAPLGEGQFYTCKSAIKFLDYTALGCPGVYSRVAPYVEAIQDGQDGLLALTPAEWLDSLSRLVESPSLRLELARNAQRKVAADWLLSKNVSRRVELYSRFAAAYQPGSKPYPADFELLRGLTRQLYDEHLRNLQRRRALISAEDRLQFLTQQLAEKDGTIAGLEDEVLAYATSRSWKLTRPLRKFFNLG